MSAAAADLALADQALQVLGALGVQLAHQRGDELGAGAGARELALEALASGGEMLGLIEASEPGAHLGAAARRDQEALLGRRASRGSGALCWPVMISTTSPLASG